MKRISLALLLLLIMTTPVFARWRRRFRRTYYPVTYSSPVDYSGCETDQQMCEREAEYQAANYAYYHVGVNIGAFEGWGTGPTATCGTCVPGYGMTLTGDASCQAANGQWFRVRSWR